MSWTFQIPPTVMEVVLGKFLTIDVHLWRILVKGCR